LLDRAAVVFIWPGAGRLLTAADLATAWLGRCWAVRWVLQDGCRNLRKQKYPEMPKLWWAIDKAAINHEAISFMSKRRMPVTQAREQVCAHGAAQSSRISV
jgi:hypothetical protein